MSKKVNDILYNDFKILNPLNKKLKYLLGVYYITDFGIIYGKSYMDFVERFVVLNDEPYLDYLTNILVDSEEFNNSAKEVNLTGLESRREDNTFLITSPPRDKKHKDGTVTHIIPDIIKLRQYPRTYVNEFKKKCYKFLDKLDSFQLRALKYVPLTDEQVAVYMMQNAVEVVIDGYRLILDHSLFPDYNKPDYEPDLSVALIPDSMMSTVTEVREDVAFFMLKFVTEKYTSYTLVKTLVA